MSMVRCVSAGCAPTRYLATYRMRVSVYRTCWLANASTAA